MITPCHTADHDAIFLQMHLHKALERDPDGNVIFTVEASNENLDLEQQRVLQAALLQSKNYFLKGGVVSKDHKHRTFKTDGYAKESLPLWIAPKRLSLHRLPAKAR